MSIGNLFPIDFFRTTLLILIQTKTEKLKRVYHLSNHLRKSHLASHHKGKWNFDNWH